MFLDVSSNILHGFILESEIFILIFQLWSDYDCSQNWGYCKSWHLSAQAQPYHRELRSRPVGHSIGLTPKCSNPKGFSSTCPHQFVRWPKRGSKNPKSARRYRQICRNCVQILFGRYAWTQHMAQHWLTCVSILTSKQVDFEAEWLSDETGRLGWRDSAETAGMTCFGTFEPKSYTLAQTLFSRV